MAQRFIIKNVKFKKRPILAKSIRKPEVLRIVKYSFLSRQIPLSTFSNR